MNAMAKQFAAQTANWQAGLQTWFVRIGRHFGRQTMRQQALNYVARLLSPIEHKTNWQLSGAVKRQTPYYSLQHLLDRACGDADVVLDDVQGYVIEHLDQPDAVLEQLLDR